MFRRKETHGVNPTLVLAFFLGALSGPQCKEMAFTHSRANLLSRRGRNPGMLIWLEISGQGNKGEGTA